MVALHIDCVSRSRNGGPVPSWRSPFWFLRFLRSLLVKRQEAREVSRSPWDEFVMRPLESGPEAKDEARSGGREESAIPPALRAPSHLIARVFSQLDCTDLLNCALVCKQWYKDTAELRDGWKNEYLEAWSMYGLCIRRDTHPPSSTCSIRVNDHSKWSDMSASKALEQMLRAGYPARNICSY